MRRVAAAAILVLAMALVATPAHAAGDEPTTIGFGATEVGPLPFGTTWVLPIDVEGTGESAPYLDRSDGTVDVFIEGIAGTYAAALPVQPGGETYFSQPAGQPLLPAGEHRVRAIFQPAAGSAFSSSQTTETAIIRIEPLALSTEFATRDVAADSLPSLRLTVRGPEGADLGARALGQWRVEVVAGSTGDVVESLTVPAARFGIAAEVALEAEPVPGEKYALSAAFIPDEGVASSVQVTDPEPLYHAVPGLSLDEQLQVPVLVPWWAVWSATAVALVLLAGLIAALVWNVRRRRRASSPATTDAGAVPQT